MQDLSERSQDQESKVVHLSATKKKKKKKSQDFKLFSQCKETTKTKQQQKTCKRTNVFGNVKSDSAFFLIFFFFYK